MLWIGESVKDLSTIAFEQWFIQFDKMALGFRITGILMNQNNPGLDFTVQLFCDEVLRLSQLGRDAATDKIVETFT